MKKITLLALLLSSSVFAQSQVYTDKDGRNIGYSTQYGNYTTYTDKTGNTGYSFSDGQTTNFTGRDGRPANPNQVIPSPQNDNQPLYQQNYKYQGYTGR